MVCFDESPEQLIEEVRQPLQPEPGRPVCHDVEYKCNGVRNLLMMCEPRGGVRDVLVTATRNKIDFAHAIKHLAERYASADVTRVVLDNLNTHKVTSLYEAFPPKQARALARKRKFHSMPKHGSWLISAEIEFAVLSNMCLNQRIANEETLKHIIAGNVAERNGQARSFGTSFQRVDRLVMRCQ